MCWLFFFFNLVVIYYICLFFSSSSYNLFLLEEGRLVSSNTRVWSCLRLAKVLSCLRLRKTKTRQYFCGKNVKPSLQQAKVNFIYSDFHIGTLLSNNLFTNLTNYTFCSAKCNIFTVIFFNTNSFKPYLFTLCVHID